MPRFFVDKKDTLGESIILSGEDAYHISFSLRMRVGENVTVCDGEGRDIECEICDITKKDVTLKVVERRQSMAEPSIDVTLYQALVKSDKFDFIVQKCTELGVNTVVPVVMERCVSRPDEKGMEKKIERWNKIAKEAAKQSGRGKVPRVLDAVKYSDALCEIKKADKGFVCYENEPHMPINEIYGGKNALKTVAFLVGPEGGISEKEAALAKEERILLAGLGKRILRTETAPLCVMSCLMMLSDNMN